MQKSIPAAYICYKLINKCIAFIIQAVLLNRSFPRTAKKIKVTYQNFSEHRM